MNMHTCTNGAACHLNHFSRCRRLMQEWEVEGNIPQDAMRWGRSERVPRVTEAQAAMATRWFVIGDVHGDFHALVLLKNFLEQVCPDHGLIFVGDLIDRGPHPAECITFILDLASQNPDRVILLAGNHDEGLRFQEESGSFISLVAPSEYTEMLRLGLTSSWLARQYEELVKALPRALLWPNGTLITHGGFPLVDLQRALPEGAGEQVIREWLNSPRALQDFTWTRISRYPSKIPNRTSSGCQYGFRDFDKFCAAISTYAAITHVITGHEHPPEGVSEHPEWQPRTAITVSGFGFQNSWDASSYVEDYAPFIPCVRLGPGSEIAVERAPVDKRVLAEFCLATIPPADAPVPSAPQPH
jgi:hypothetical protein